MCRLVLMNRQAIILLDKELGTLFVSLEKALGGDGNGIGLLYDSGRTRIRKGVSFRATYAANEIRFAARSSATWALFHTRLATTAHVAARFCHPFQQGKLILAHNGHDEPFARLGSLIGKSDSCYITQTWIREHRSLESLQHRCGVFLGFYQGRPFVVKGQSSKDLVLAYHTETGAILFSSQLSASLRARFDTCIDVGRFVWQGEHLDLTAIERRQPPPALEEKALITTSRFPKEEKKVAV